MDFTKFDNDELRTLWAQVNSECHRRGLLANGSVVGGYAQDLVRDRLHLTLAPPGTSHYDAFRLLPSGQGCEKYQIKGRKGRVSRAEINSLTELDENHFDFLVAVVFRDDLTVLQAFKFPHSVVCEIAEPTKNDLGFRLTQDNIKREGVKEITTLLV